MRMIGMGSLLGTPIILLAVFIMVPMAFAAILNALLLFLQAAWMYIVSGVVLFLLVKIIIARIGRW
jgi:hypothetical protein